jgi:hypothetical protein
MSERELFEAAAAQEGWHARTQIDVLLQYIENQGSAAAFEDFLAQMCADALENEYADDPDDGHGVQTQSAFRDATLAPATLS